MTLFIAESIFWMAILAGAAVVYQSAILPGIRLKLRYRTFALRDRLRLLVINGNINEAHQAFRLLHENLNSMSVSLSRYDLARVVRSLKTIDEEKRAKVSAAMDVMESAPTEIKEIYKESLHVLILALVFNSIFLFLFAAVLLLVSTLFTVGVVRVRSAVAKRLDKDTKFAFFAPELSAV